MCKSSLLHTQHTQPQPAHLSAQLPHFLCTPACSNVFEEPLASAISGQSIANLPAALAKLPSLAELSKMTPEERAAAFDLEGLTSEVSAQLAKLDLAELRRMNVSSITDIKLDDLRKLNLTALATELVSNVNTTQVTSAVTRSIGGIAAMIPRLPDPAYIAGFKLDPEALEAAGLPNVRSVPELFATIMRGTLGAHTPTHLRAHMHVAGVMARLWFI